VDGHESAQENCQIFQGLTLKRVMGTFNCFGRELIPASDTTGNITRIADGIDWNFQDGKIFSLDAKLNGPFHTAGGAIGKDSAAGFADFDVRSKKMHVDLFAP
jgi:hypothetical protein